MLDLQKLTLRRLLETQDSGLYSKLSPTYFTGSNLIMYGKIEHFYRNNLRIPTIDEFLVLKKEISLQDYFESQILDEDNKNDSIQNEFLVSQLQDHYVRDKTIDWVDSFLESLEDYESSEIMDSFQNHLLDLNKSIPMGDELIDVALLETVPSEDTFTMYPSGLSEEYDATNIGFALQELICIGGRRGSGKSILSLNATVSRFLGTSHTQQKVSPSTAVFFSIEMRYIEVYYRLMSILSGVPFLDFMRNKLNKEQKYLVAKTKMDTFYKPSKLINEELDKLQKTGEIERFDEKIKVEKPSMKDNRFFIIDDPALSLNRIDHYCNLFSNKYPDNFTMATVDYLNIIRAEDSIDWKTQIKFAESLKGMARKYDITMLTAYQVDATLEARFAKGILDAADRAFTFPPAPPDGEDSDQLTMYIAKIRNGKNFTFTIPMDWECTRIGRNVDSLTKKKNGYLLPGAQNGSGTSEEGNEAARDV